MITLKLKSSTFWDKTSRNLLDGYQYLQKIAASVFGVKEENLDFENAIGSSKHYDKCVSNHNPSQLQTLPFITDLRSSNRVFSFPKACIGNK